MSKLILTDIDETVLQYGLPFQAWCQGQGYETHGNLREGYSVEAMLGVSWDDAVSIMTHFMEDGGLEDQPPEPDALNVLPRLYAAGFRFVGITACGGAEWFQTSRKRLLEATFGFPWESLHVVPLGESKTRLLNAYDPAIWVEDHAGHAVTGVRYGHESYLLNRVYNAGKIVPRVTRVDSWHEIEEGIAPHIGAHA